jgi:hypothetical protein
MSGYGTQIKIEKTEAVCLWWYSLSLPDSGIMNLDTVNGNAANGLNGPGVYVFEGSHDSRPEGGIIYIGQVGRGEGPHPTHERDLRTRASESWKRFTWSTKTGKGRSNEMGLYADVWRLTLRWAYVATDVIDDVEALLLRAHAPSFNAQEVRSELRSCRATELVVMNAGAKGRLLPVVAGKYFDEAFWNGLG